MIMILNEKIRNCMYDVFYINQSDAHNIVMQFKLFNATLNQDLKKHFKTIQ